MKKIVVLIILTLGLLVAGMVFTLPGQQKLFSLAMSAGTSKAGMVKKSINIDDHNIVYIEREGGGETSDTLILLHGFTANKYNWLQFVANIEAPLRVIAIDWPAHGESTFLETGNYEVATQANRLKIFMDKLSIPKAHIVGNSMGGAIATDFAFRFPELVSTLTLMNSAGADNPNTFSTLEKGFKEGKNLLVINNLEDFDNAFSLSVAKPVSIPYPIKAVMAQTAVDRTERYRYVFRQVNKGISRKDIDYLKEISAPTLIIWGQEDQVLDVGNAKMFEKRIPNNRVVIYDAVGHLPMIEIPKRSADDVINFIKAN